MLQQPPNERILICEGASCNPDIKDYDEQIIQYGAGRSNKPFVVEWCRRLIHTRHEQVSGRNWAAGGWQGGYRCTRCGHVRRF